MRNLRIKYRILPLLFIGALFFPFINGKIGLIQEIESSENRSLAAKPTFDLLKPDPFPRAYEDWFNDHINLKNRLVLLNNSINYFIFHRSSVPQKLNLGSNGWMYFNNLMLPSFRQSNLFNQKELQQIKDELLYRNQYLSEHNAVHYLAIVPAKASVYPEFLTGNQREHINDSSRTDQLIAFLNGDKNIRIIDLRAALKKKKDIGQLFHKSDHHWNSLGAMVAAQEVLNKVRIDFPQIPEFVKLDNFRIEPYIGKGGDLAKLAGINTVVPEKNNRLHPDKNMLPELIADKNKRYQVPKGFAYGWGYEIRRTTQQQELPNAMIIRDSYGDYIIPFLSYGFNNSLYLWDQWEYTLNKNIFEAEKPQVFITMVTEAQLHKLLEQNPH